MTFALSAKYRHKIKTPNELREVFGAPPRRNKVIMCHGVFDIVHPGHVRHLLYAKSKAHALIASLTADRHIDKGKYRPHVPQDLRAINLAAFEMVDYVLIDDNATPLDNLRIIQPDYFAKGYEYTATGDLHPDTQAELEVVQAYGGELLFTPGDIVYSSSNLINLAPPVLKFDKLLTLMDVEGVTFGMLRRTLDQMSGRHVHVVGDTIVDSYTHCAMVGGQTKTPTMSVLFENKVDFIGGAAVVAEHMKAAGAQVLFSTVLGNDRYKDFVLEGLARAGVDCRPVIDETRPTVNKNAIVAGGYRLLKIDTLDNSSISDPILQQLTRQVAETTVDAVVLSDFRHGIFNRRTIPKFVEAIPDGCYRVADSQVASRWGNITDFAGFDLITPNEREARFALGDQDSGLRHLGATLYDAAQCKLLMLKLGDRGVITCRGPGHERLDSFFVVDSFVERLIDAVGAGDALLAYGTLAMLATCNPVIATILGSMAAACECEMDGNVPVKSENISAKIGTIEKQVSEGR
jgi:rfaE bifunctional protein kinase chain/domain